MTVISLYNLYIFAREYNQSVMKIEFSTQIGEIVRRNFKTAQIFEKYDIDFCCGGGTSLSDACAKSDADMDSLISEIESSLQAIDPESKYIEQLGLDQLCDYIVNRHHSYVSENIPFLQAKFEKLCSVHGSAHSELFELKKLFETMAGNLVAHMKKEEFILFPLICRIAKNYEEGNLEPLESGKIQVVISELEEEHQAEGERLIIMRSLSNNYVCPPDGCNTFEVTYRTLAEFEQDLHRHIHLENNILFKKAINLEQKLMKK